MTQITDFGRTEHRLLSAAIQKAVEDVAKEFGVKLLVGGGHIGDTGGDIKVKVELLNVAGGKTGKQVEFERYAALYGMKPSDYGKEFTSRGTRYRVTGILPRGQRYNVQCMRVIDGRAFKFVASDVRRQIDYAESVSSALAA